MTDSISRSLRAASSMLAVSPFALCHFSIFQADVTDTNPPEQPPLMPSTKEDGEVSVDLPLRSRSRFLRKTLITVRAITDLWLGHVGVAEVQTWTPTAGRRRITGHCLATLAQWLALRRIRPLVAQHHSPQDHCASRGDGRQRLQFLQMISRALCANICSVSFISQRRRAPDELRYVSTKTRRSEGRPPSHLMSSTSPPGFHLCRMSPSRRASDL